ncbi:MAG: hypothetical protein HYZ74_08460 [Elusimicrobia bacterium]|nr:hypothetical protein [Elusimicrobiota bacterium]
MRAIPLLLAAVLASPVPAATPTREFTTLAPGRYTVSLTGLVSTVCARAIAAEWRVLAEVESATVDFDKSEAIIAVRLNRTLRVSDLRRRLRRAEKLANLDARYDVRNISYRLGK